MAQRVTIIGPPGTGKTTALKRIYKFLTGNKDPDVIGFITKYRLDTLLKDTYSSIFDDVIFITFTTSAVKVLKERDVDNVYTMHSYITRLLFKNKVVSYKALQRDVFASVMIQLGYGYDFRDRFSSHPSNVAESQYSYYYNVFYNKNDKEVLQIIRDHEDKRIYDRINSYVAWKNEHGMVDYVEVLRKFLNSNIKTLSLDEEEENEPRVLILDEVQDFSPLQWAVVHRLEEIGSFDYIIVAGDPNQSIYAFQGATPSQFREFIDKSTLEIVLDKSFRLPSLVQKKAEMLTKWLGTTWKYLPKEEAGSVRVIKMKKRHLSYLDNKLLEEILPVLRRAQKLKKSVYILLRTNKQVKDFERRVIGEGYSVSRIKDDYSLSDLFDEVLEFEETGYLGELLYYAILSTSEEATTLRNTARNKNDVSDLQLIELLEKYFNEQTLENTRDPASIIEFARFIQNNYLEVLSEDEKELYSLMKSRKNGYKLFVDTMHASKGEEADIVIVIDFVNSRIKKEIARSKKALEEEVRTLYVAMTRAREELYIITSNSKNSILQHIRF